MMPIRPWFHRLPAAARHLVAAFAALLLPAGALAATQDLLTFPNADLFRGARIAAMAAQADGKLVVVGEITTAGFAAAGHIVRLNADGGIDGGFSAIANAPVHLVAVSSDAIYVAGDFTAINGNARPGIAKLSMVNGSVDTLWNGTVNQLPAAMAADPVSGALFVAGPGLDAGGASGRVAYRLDPFNGLAGTWTPQVGLATQAGTSVLVADGALWLGTVESGAGLSRVHKLAPDTGFAFGGYAPATFWPGQASGPNFLAHDGVGSLYAGSRGTSVPAGRTLARLDAGLGSLSWASTDAPPASALAADAFTLYVGTADLTRDRARYWLDQRSVATGSLNSRFYADQPLEGAIHSILVRGSNLVLAGEFRRIDGLARMGAAEVAQSGGSAGLFFAPQLFRAGIVRAIARLTGGDFLLGGEIDRVGITPVENLVYMNSIGNSLAAAPVGTNGSVLELRVLGGHVYVGGYFTQVGIAARRGAARLFADTASLDNNWAPQVDGAVRRFASDGTALYLGGDFLNVGQGALDGNGLPVGGTNRACLAKVDTTSGSLAAGWNPALVAAKPCVRAIEFAGGKLYVAANYQANLLVAGFPHLVVRLSPSNAAADTWVIDALGNVAANVLHLAGSNLYVAGTFTSTDQFQSRMLIVDTVGGGVGSFLRPAASAPASVDAIASDAAHVYLGGTDVAGTPVLRRYRLAGYEEDEAFAPVLGPVDSSGKGVLGIAPTADSRVIVGGGFTSAGGSARLALAAFDTTPSVVLTVNPGGFGTVAAAFDPFSCGPAVPCSRSFRSGTALTLTATPQAGYVFAGWSSCPSPSGNTCSVLLNSPATVTAVWAVQTFTINLSVVGPGTVTGPGGLDCPGVCSISLPTGTSVTLTATPGASAELAGWSGFPGCLPTSNTCTFTLAGNMNPTVNFRAVSDISFLLSDTMDDTAFFGYVTLGSTSGPVEMRLRNFGTTNASTPAIVLPSGWNFVFNTCGALLFPGTDCSMQVRFAPLATGLAEGFVTVGSSVSLRIGVRGYGIAAGTPVAVLRRGIAISPQGAQKPLDFGSGRVGIGNSRSLQVYNAGNAAFTVTSVTSLTDPFATFHNCASVAPNNVCSVTVNFNPGTPGDFTTSLAILTTGGNLAVPVRARAEPATLRGAVDPTFYSARGERLYTTFRGRTYASRIAMRADGSFVMGGTGTLSGGPDSASFLYRFDAGGIEDPAFGGAFGFTGRAPLALYPGRTSDRLGGIAVLSDDRIIVSSMTPGTGTVVDAHVRRTKSDGGIDTTFGTSGSTLIANGGGSSLLVRTDGRIVVAGRSGTAISVARLTAAGAPDPTFGSAGQLVVPVNAWTGSHVEMKQLADESLVVAFNYESAPGNLDVGVIKLTASGALDTTFGSLGRTNVALSTRNETFRDLQLRSDGRIVLGLSSSRAAQPLLHDFQVVQLTAAGAGDPSFGAGGVVTVAFGAQDASLAAIEPIPGGGLLLAGHVVVDAFDSSMATALLAPNGALDTTWGNGGTLVTPLSENHDMPLDIARAPDGRIVAVGEVDIVDANTGGGYSSLLMVRLEAPDAPFVPPPAGTLRPDFNGDGKTDLLWQNTNGRAAIWLMNGTAPSATLEIIGTATGWSVSQMADFDGNGKTDLLWQHTDGRMAIYLMNGTVPASTLQILGAGGGWSVTHTPDLNGDGKADLLFQNTNGSVAVWTMDGTTRTGGSTILGAGTGWSVIKTGDFDGDGKTDLLWKHTDGRHAIWLMNGIAVKATAQILNAGGGWTAAHAADLNGDGKADIVWQNANGTIAAWLMNGTTMASGSTILGAGSGWSVVRTGDFNGDGRADLLFQHTDGRAAIWLMNGLAATATAQILNAGGGWSAARLADLNGDGKADIVWANTNGSTAVWLMNGTTMTGGTTLIGAGSPWSVSTVSQ